MTSSHLENRLFHHLRGAGRASDVYLQRELKEIGLPLAQFYVLSCLWQRDGVTQNWIGEKTFMTEGVTSQLIKEMVKQDFVEQRRDDADKRKRLIFLRPKANEMKGPALDIWAQCLKDVSEGLASEDISNFATLADRMRLNALSAYQAEFGEQKKVRGETLSLIKALTMSSEESLSIINTELKFVYMNQRFRQLFDMPEDALSVGDPAHKFYRRIAQNPIFKIKSPERYVFERMNDLRNLKTKRSIIRKSGEDLYFRISQSRLEDGSILTNTERLTDEVAARQEMQDTETALARQHNRNEAFRLEGVKIVLDPLKAIADAAERLHDIAPGNAAKRKAVAINGALSLCLLNLEKVMSEL